MISKKEYTNLVNVYSDRICHYLSKNLRDKSMAEDLTQDSFLKLWNNRLFLQSDVAKSWLFKTSYRLMLNYLRKNNREVLEQDNIEYTSSQFTDYESIEFLEMVFSLLSTEEKSIVLLRDREGYAYHEIAEIMNTTESGVKTKLFRARQKFKKITFSIHQNDKHIRYE